MKIQSHWVLYAAALLFLGFCLGFMAGRNSVAEPVMISVPEYMLTEPVYPEETAEVEFPLDLNRATNYELMQLPGIGETMAMRITAYRRERGGFRSLSDLYRVEGMTEKIFEKIQDLVIIGG